MKKRIGFVSNSSSSSFIIKKENLTTEQIDQIKNHIEVSKADMKNEDFYYSPEWNITEDRYTIKGSTSMDNFNMHKFLELIGAGDVIFGEY